MALREGGLPAVNTFWDSIQDKSVISDPCFHAFTDAAIQTGDLDNIVITNEYFVKRFLSHVEQKFGPSILLPSIEVEGTNLSYYHVKIGFNWLVCLLHTDFHMCNTTVAVINVFMCSFLFSPKLVCDVHTSGSCIS